MLLLTAAAIMGFVAVNGEAVGPVMVLLAETDDYDPAEAKERGAFRVMSKPTKEEKRQKRKDKKRRQRKKMKRKDRKDAKREANPMSVSYVAHRDVPAGPAGPDRAPGPGRPGKTGRPGKAGRPGGHGKPGTPGYQVPLPEGADGPDFRYQVPLPEARGKGGKGLGKGGAKRHRSALRDSSDSIEDVEE